MHARPDARGFTGAKFMTIFIGTVGADWLDGSASADHIIGLDGNDMLNGLDGDDLLEGGEGSDSLDGGAGADEMRGGLGNDVYYVDDAGDLVIEDSNGGGSDQVIVSLGSYTLPANVENATARWEDGAAIYGNALNNHLMGWWANDRLEGGAGNDYLHGGSGSDILVGGTGNDRYHLNSEDEGEVDTVIEFAGGGIDTVELWWWSHHVLAANVENVEIYATDAITLIANSSNNIIQLATGAMTIDGGSGNDTITFDSSHYWVQVDLLTNDNAGGAADDSFTGIENVTGTFWNDVLRGTNGANILIGGLGADTLEGRGGNDVYHLDNMGDIVVEAPGGGTDEVRVSGGIWSYVMPDEVERLRNTGGNYLYAYGNALNNDMFGGVDADVFYGGGGHDNLNGGAGDDTLYGEAGHDMLSGGAGADTMAGGDGNDAYTVDSSTDSVVELADEGIDVVYASTSSYLLPDNVENLISNGQGAFTGTGNDFANVIQGGSGDDVLSGLAGDDELRGGSGADTLAGGDGDDLLNGGGGADVMTGGAGADRFRFSGYESGTGAAADRIEDFTSGQDLIDLAGIDADLWTPGDQAFAFIGNAAFSGAAGELRFASEGNNIRLQAETNGDGFSDYEILLTGPVVPLISDFIL
jgi:Ca2+-binding RTX toxin-like protein